MGRDGVLRAELRSEDAVVAVVCQHASIVMRTPAATMEGAFHEMSMCRMVGLNNRRV